MPLRYEIDVPKLLSMLEKQKVSQTLLAEEIKVSPITINRWISGAIKKVSIRNIRNVSEFLRVPAESLIKNNDGGEFFVSHLQPFESGAEIYSVFSRLSSQRGLAALMDAFSEAASIGNDGLRCQLMIAKLNRSMSKFRTADSILCSISERHHLPISLRNSIEVERAICTAAFGQLDFAAFTSLAERCGIFDFLDLTRGVLASYANQGQYTGQVRSLCERILATPHYDDYPELTVYFEIILGHLDFNEGNTISAKRRFRSANEIAGICGHTGARDASVIVLAEIDNFENQTLASALATTESIITNQAGLTPFPYQVYSDLCFRAGKYQEALKWGNFLLENFREHPTCSFKTALRLRNYAMKEGDQENFQKFSSIYDEEKLNWNGKNFLQYELERKN